MRLPSVLHDWSHLAKRLQHYTPSPAAAARPAARAKAKPKAKPAAAAGGMFGGLFGAKKKAAPVRKKAAAAPAPGPALKLTNKQAKGLYLWGGTGTGKTFMMDMFHDTIPIQSKNRIHFHEWMIDVHERLHRLQKGSSKSSNTADDLVAQVAADMMKDGWLLCFDEFQVTHISDAIILKRIFEVLFSRGAVVVATSNRPPEDLYLNGLNRGLFLPFIPMLNEFCEVHAIGAEVDYRLISTADEEDDRVYLHPNGPNEQKAMESKFSRLCQGLVQTGAQLEAQGRKVSVPKCGQTTNVAWFDFKDLCDKALGAADYLAVATSFHTVFIANVPALTLQERDQVRRFITLIDALYEGHTKVIVSADKDPISLFYVSEKDRETSIADEIFAWDRTVSRLVEMQSTKYLMDAVRNMRGSQFLEQFSINSLTDEDKLEFWKRYDSDDSGELDMDELRKFLEDLLEKAKGHRNLTDETFEACLAIIDTNKDGVIQYSEFSQYLGNYSMVSFKSL